jgi:hypothetical protein
MARYRRAYTHKRYRHDSYNAGRERALQHIREAHELSGQLGGTDKDVKEYFFSLPASQLREIMNAYERAFGRSKREYAEVAFSEWKSGKKQMSGLVASRLFSLLPPLMPFEKKYDLVANLWCEKGPHSHKVLRIGPDADIEKIVEKTHAHVIETVQHYTIPEPLQQRFQWLSGGDVKVQQQLMNHLLEMEKHQSIELTRLQIPMMLKQIRDHADYTHRLVHSLQIGKHKFEMVYDKDAFGVTLEDPTGRLGESTRGNRSWLWLAWIVGGLILLWLMYHR